MSNELEFKYEVEIKSVEKKADAFKRSKGRTEELWLDG